MSVEIALLETLVVKLPPVANTSALPVSPALIVLPLLIVRLPPAATVNVLPITLAPLIVTSPLALTVAP